MSRLQGVAKVSGAGAGVEGRLQGVAKVSGAGAGVEGRLQAAAQVRGVRTSAALVYLARRMEVQAVFFDLDDTLVLTHAADRSAHQAVSRLLATRVPCLDHQAVVDHFVQQFISQPWDPHKQVEVTEWRSQLWNGGLNQQDVDDMDLARDVQSCFDSERLLAFQWADGVEAVLKNLQSQGVKVGIITNGHPKIQRAKLKACRAEDLFSIILVGGEEPNEKPHREIFLKACKIADCEPDKAIMVGDNLKTDIQGGQNAGFLATIWVNVHGSEKPTGGPKPHHTVKNISELQDVLKHYGLLG